MQHKAISIDRAYILRLEQLKESTERATVQPSKVKILQDKLPSLEEDVGMPINADELGEAMEPAQEKQITESDDFDDAEFYEADDKEESNDLPQNLPESTILLLAKSKEEIMGISAT